jgi:hypothetical protein
MRSAYQALFACAEDADHKRVILVVLGDYLAIEQVDQILFAHLNAA